MKKTSLLLVSLFALLMANCAETKYRLLRNVDKPIRLSTFKNDPAYTLVRNFEVSHMRQFLFYGTVPVHSKSLEEILNQEIYDNYDAIGDIEITERYTALDGLLDAILFGLYRPYTVIITGSIYKRKVQ
ncbi:hypothetical protein [Leptospira idonii]|uniref:Lipoprotein n=1 Tax=Leptospira idonii TaxID=1193500 RepID=A0A4R9M7I9_9LEPT|nr:hypothetical protein [Leptospira idonii]TGN21059.1 hypothetical protein EHS15_00635 [Leptospira idonii]